MSVEAQQVEWLTTKSYPDELALACPVCGEWYSHIFRVYSRIGGDEGKTPYLGTQGIIEGGERRAAVVVVVQGESCGHWFRLVVQQRKGINLLDCEILSPEEAQAEEKRARACGEFFFSGDRCEDREDTGMKHTTEFYLEDGKTAIRTQARTEDEFLSGIAALCADAAVSAPVSDPKEIIPRLKSWIGQCVDICCKLRGYKADVDEERILIAGGRMLSATPIRMVDEVGNVTS